MRVKWTRCAVSGLVLMAALALTPSGAYAVVTDQQTAAITAAVNTALASGNTDQLQVLVTQLVIASPDDAATITTLASQVISTALAANPALGQAPTTPTAPGAPAPTSIAEAITDAVVGSAVTAAPAQGGAVLLAIQSSSLPPALQTAALTRGQAALIPAAGGAGGGGGAGAGAGAGGAAGGGGGGGPPPPFTPTGAPGGAGGTAPPPQRASPT